MSDYLWDKTGEPDEDVKRLEELLGSLRHDASHNLKLPPGQIESNEKRFFSFRARIAIAAAITFVAVLAGLWLNVLQRQTDTDLRVDHIAHSGDQSGVSPSLREASTRMPDKIGPAEDNQAGRQAETDLGLNHKATSKRVLHVDASPSSKSGRRALITNVKRRVEANGDEPQRRVKSKEIIEAERAKEELMLALHLASAKLNLAERKAPGAVTDLTLDVNQTIR